MTITSTACTADHADKLSSESASESIARPQGKVLVCIGDSITYGQGVANRSRDAWPALLQEKLGDPWTVVNLGVSGTTLLDDGLHPYRATGNVERALALDADMAIIMLGTNDSVDSAWDVEAYQTQLDALANQLENASTREIKLAFMIPPHAFFGPGETPQRQAMNELIDSEIRNSIVNVAAKHNAPVVDLFAFTEGRHEWFPDDLHPDEAANKALADYIYGQLFE